VSPSHVSYRAAAGLFVLAWAALASPWLLGFVTIPWDAKAHFYPQLQFLAQSLHRGEAPFWTPFVFSGSPQIADPQSLIFSPPFLALALLDPSPSLQAFDAVVLGSLGLGGVFILLFFRDRGWHPAGALVAALAFAFGASAAWRVQHVGQVLSLAAWPIALFLLLRALERRSLAYGFVAGLVAGVMALGRDQVAYLGLWLLAAVVLDHWLGRPFRSRFGRSLGPLVAGALGGALVVVVPVMLTVLLAESSNRPAIDYAGAGQGSLHPALLLTAAIPNLFGADGPFKDYWGPPSPLWGPVDLFLARNMGVLYMGALPMALLVAGSLRGWFSPARCASTRSPSCSCSSMRSAARRWPSASCSRRCRGSISSAVPRMPRSSSARSAPFLPAMPCTGSAPGASARGLCRVSAKPPSS
jgi:hypothetical protein